jgi:hypothetical protein
LRLVFGRQLANELRRLVFPISRLGKSGSQNLSPFFLVGGEVDAKWQGASDRLELPKLLDELRSRLPMGERSEQSIALGNDCL